MNEKFFQKCLCAYLLGKAKLALLLSAFALIFAIIFHLYHVPLESTLYASVICLCIGIVTLIIGFSRYYTFHQALAEAAQNIRFSIDVLPDPHTALEREYQHIIRLLYDDRNRIINQNAASKQFMQDYYTLWVHQIKIPISAMYLLLGEDGKSSPIGIELFKIEQYVEMALSYARLDSDTTDYVFKKVPLDPIVKQAVKKYAPLFISKKIKLQIEDFDLSVVTDEKWLSFALEQILSNSLKYTKQGSISIYLQKSNILVIEDTGIGIAPEDISRVGEKGFTGYNGRTGRKSTGLGLYLCKETLKRLNHTIRIESELGKGTRVFINLNRRHMMME